MNTYKAPKHYVPIPNALLADASLSMAAKVMFCVLAYLLNIPEFVVCRGALRKYCKKGNSAISAALAELRERGYLHQYRNRVGSKWRWSYVLYAFPFGDGGIISTNNLPANAYRTPRRGYAKISVSALLRHDISDTVKVVYFYLASKVSNPDFVLHTWAIATALGCSQKTVQRSIYKLKSMGLVDATQSRDDDGKMAAMCYTVYFPGDDASAGANTRKTNTGGTNTEGTNTGGTSAGGTKTTYINQLETNKTDSFYTKINQIVLMNPDKIKTYCEWCDDRYDNIDYQNIYSSAVRSIECLFKNNTDMRNAIASHLAHDDSALSKIVDEVTEICYERIYFPPEDATPISNPTGYINQVVKDYILNWEEKNRTPLDKLANA